jgi:hypothetical protein
MMGMTATEKKATHTPGPWRVEKDTTLVWGNCLIAEDGTPEYLGYPVAEACRPSTWQTSGKPDHVEQDSNARLIAAAPDLLEALRELVEIAETAIRQANNDGGMWDEDATLKPALDAIAKAEGNSQ